VGGLVSTWTSIQKLSEFEPFAGMLAVGSVPATLNTPWGRPVKGAGSDPD
jgi:hypothetical protein